MAKDTIDFDDLDNMPPQEIIEVETAKLPNWDAVSSKQNVFRQKADGSYYLTLRACESIQKSGDQDPWRQLIDQVLETIVEIQASIPGIPSNKESVRYFLEEYSGNKPAMQYVLSLVSIKPETTSKVMARAVAAEEEIAVSLLEPGPVDQDHVGAATELADMLVSISRLPRNLFYLDKQRDRVILFVPVKMLSKAQFLRRAFIIAGEVRYKRVEICGHMQAAIEAGDDAIWRKGVEALASRLDALANAFITQATIILKVVGQLEPGEIDTLITGLFRTFPEVEELLREVPDPITADIPEAAKSESKRIEKAYLIQRLLAAASQDFELGPKAELDYMVALRKLEPRLVVMPEAEVDDAIKRIKGISNLLDTIEKLDEDEIAAEALRQQVRRTIAELIGNLNIDDALLQDIAAPGQPQIDAAMRQKQGISAPDALLIKRGWVAQRLAELSERAGEGPVPIRVEVPPREAGPDRLTQALMPIKGELDKVKLESLAKALAAVSQLETALVQAAEADIIPEDLNQGRQVFDAAMQRVAPVLAVRRQLDQLTRAMGITGTTRAAIKKVGITIAAASITQLRGDRRYLAYKALFVQRAYKLWTACNQAEHEIGTQNIEFSVNTRTDTRVQAIIRQIAGEVNAGFNQLELGNAPAKDIERCLQEDRPVVLAVGDAASGYALTIVRGVDSDRGVIQVTGKDVFPVEIIVAYAGDPVVSGGRVRVAVSGKERLKIEAAGSATFDKENTIDVAEVAGALNKGGWLIDRRNNLYRVEPKSATTRDILHESVLRVKYKRVKIKDGQPKMKKGHVQYYRAKQDNITGVGEYRWRLAPRFRKLIVGGSISEAVVVRNESGSGGKKK